jgi:hypothetical protein
MSLPSSFPSGIFHAKAKFLGNASKWLPVLSLKGQAHGQF